MNISKKHNRFATSTAESKTEEFGNWLGFMVFINAQELSYSVSIPCNVMFRIRICILVNALSGADSLMVFFCITCIFRSCCTERHES